MMESYELARTKAYMQGGDDSTDLLPKTGVPDLDQAYVTKGGKIVAGQLKRGGIRLAKVLNDALDP
jgi:S1/P1 Nuclease